jgi:hypothetical protein
MGTTGPETQSLSSRIAALVHSHFDGLPKRSKPIVRDDGTAEWVPMTGIVLVKGELLSFSGSHFILCMWWINIPQYFLIQARRRLQ